MKVLVTGGTGFIGSHVVEKLCNEGFSVRCISKDLLNTEELNACDVEIIINDLNNNINWDSVLSDVDIVYHIAGVTRARYYKEYYEQNFIATKNFIKVCSEYSNIKRFVYLSSLTAVGPELNNIKVDETTEYHPVSDYGKSKMLAELEVLKYRDKIPVTILRPSAVYGPRERNLFIYMKTIKRGFQLVIGLRKKYNNLIYVNDLADAIVSFSLNEKAQDQIYFIGSELSYSNELIGQTMSRVINKHPLNIYVPHCIVFSICGIAELIGKVFNKDVLLNIQKARELTQSRWNCSVEKAKSIGFSPKISLYDGFFNTYSWYQKAGWL